MKVVGELKRKRTLAASRGFLAAARLSCSISQKQSRSDDCNFTTRTLFYDISVTDRQLHLNNFVITLWLYIICSAMQCVIRFNYLFLFRWEVCEYSVERKKLTSNSDHGIILTGKLHSVYDQLICYYVQMWCKHVPDVMCVIQIVLRLYKCTWMSVISTEVYCVWVSLTNDEHSYSYGLKDYCIISPLY